MPSSLIAGHAFDKRGFCVAQTADGTCCGRRWLDIRHCDLSYVDEAGWAHTGKLSTFEARQIMSERSKEDTMFDQLVGERNCS